MKNKKISIAIVSLTGCEGCCFAVLDWPQTFIELKEKIEIKNFRLFEEDVHLAAEKYDIAFVEGGPLLKKDIERLKKIRKNSKIMIALGSCAQLGGIYHLKNYQDKNRSFNHVYAGAKGIDNLDVRPLGEIVKVDFAIPGCPITAPEFFNFIYQLIIGKQPEIKQHPVCYECQIRGYECVLQNGVICLGPMTLGGCGAICLKSKQGCWGCRGILEDAEASSLVKKLKEKYTDTEIGKVFEVFGVKELLNL